MLGRVPGRRVQLVQSRIRTYLKAPAPPRGPRCPALRWSVQAALCGGPPAVALTDAQEWIPGLLHHTGPLTFQSQTCSHPAAGSPRRPWPFGEHFPVSAAHLSSASLSSRWGSGAHPEACDSPTAQTKDQTGRTHEASPAPLRSGACVSLSGCSCTLRAVLSV